MTDTIKNLFDEDVPISEIKNEMGKPPVEEVVIVNGEEIPKRIYNLCINNYLKILYGD